MTENVPAETGPAASLGVSHISHRRVGPGLANVHAGHDHFAADFFGFVFAAAADSFAADGFVLAAASLRPRRRPRADGASADGGGPSPSSRFTAAFLSDVRLSRPTFAVASSSLLYAASF